jgi:hypothetical protein
LTRATNLTCRQAQGGPAGPPVQRRCLGVLVDSPLPARRLPR